MPDAHYETLKLAELYDLTSGWSEDRDFYVSLAGSTPIRILDLGCGTGLICNAYAAKGHAVTGLDPAASMLKIARQKPHGGRIEWVAGNAQTFNLDTQFDLVIMTGHAFQVLLDTQAVRDTFAAVRRHLAPSGRFVFETRNPAIDWASRWNRSGRLTVRGDVVSVERRILERNDACISFETEYVFPDESLISRSTLRFWSLRELEGPLADSGLAVENVYGDWQMHAFNPEVSEEIILTVRAH